LWNWQELKWQTNLSIEGATLIKFAETRTSGVVLKDGTDIRKGAQDAAKKYCTESGNNFPEDIAQAVIAISSKGGTPLVVVKTQFKVLLNCRTLSKRE
jgi:K+-transporting ATPase ATPase B chain